MCKFPDLFSKAWVKRWKGGCDTKDGDMLTEVRRHSRELPDARWRSRPGASAQVPARVSNLHRLLAKKKPTQIGIIADRDY